MTRFDDGDAPKIEPSCEIWERGFLFGRHVMLCTDCTNAVDDAVMRMPIVGPIAAERITGVFAAAERIELCAWFDEWLKNPPTP